MALICPRRRLPWFLFILVMLSAAARAGGEAPADAGWDQNSWREVIADDCRAFFGPLVWAMLVDRRPILS